MVLAVDFDVTLSFAGVVDYELMKMDHVRVCYEQNSR